MLFASITLAALAVILAWPVPLLLARASWPARAPGTALALWQSIALAGGLSMIGALTACGLIPFGDNVIPALLDLWHHLVSNTLPDAATLPTIFALCLAFLLTGHLLLNLALTAVRTERQRRRHRSLVDLLSAPLPDRPDTRVLSHPAPVAYCLPGATRSITVLSQGLLELLDDDELRAVIAHERGHLHQRHHLVLLAFKSWHSALPWFPIANRAENAVGLLVEMLADDQARRYASDDTLATAIALVASQGLDEQSAPTAHADSSFFDELVGPEISPALVWPRVERLSSPQRPLSNGARATVIGAAIALLLVPTLLLVTS